jgi:hypothetical protein
MRFEGLKQLTGRVLVITGVVLSALVASAAPASAQWRVGGFLGAEHESSWDEFLVIGADARTPVGTKNMEVNPRFSFFVRDFVTRIQLDLNVIKRLDVASASRIEPYVGTGLAFERLSFEGGVFDSQSAVGFNYILGATLKSSGRVQTFAQFVYTVLNDSPNNAVVSVGVHYKLSR